MSDVKRSLRVFGIIGCLECLFLQEICEARGGDETGLFMRETSVLLAGPRQAAPHDRAPSSIDRQHDQSPERPILQSPTSNFSPVTSVMDSFPKSTSAGELSGRVIKLSGDFQNRNRKSGIEIPLKTKVYLFKGKVASGLATGELQAPSIVDPRVVAVVDTDEFGRYQAKLPPGIYTPFIEVNGKLEQSVFDRDLNFDHVKVETGRKSQYDLKDNSEAFF